MTRQGVIERWGSDLGLRIPTDIADRAGLLAGTTVDIDISDAGRIGLSRSCRRFALDELLAGMTPDREHSLDIYWNTDESPL